MNDNGTPSVVLPRLDDERVAAIEHDVFARISADRQRHRRRRVRAWMTAGVAAAVVIVAAVIAPSLSSSLSTAGGSAAVAPASDSAGDESAALPESARDAAGPGESAAGGAADTSREVMTTGSARVVVDDVPGAAERIAASAEARGGYVESLTIGAAGADGAVVDGGGGVVPPGPVPGGSGSGWITVRVPSADLDATIAELRELGEVTDSTVARQDVTDQAIDVRARIAAGEASVARLTELMSQAADVADLIAAETALSERQATLEADRQQLAWLEGQVALSTLTVELVPHSPTVEADPAGFADGIVAGWNGLVAALNGLVIAVGFLLPWLAVIAAATGVVWGIVRLIRRVRRGRRADEQV